MHDDDRSLIEAAFADRARVIRVMPNTPALIGRGMTAISPAANATDDDLAFARSAQITVRASVEFAENSPIPEPGELYTDVYANPQKNLSPTATYTHGAKNPLL